MTAPERILAWKSDGDGSYHGPVEGDVEPIEFMTTEYTRTDIHQAALDRIAELEGALGEIVAEGIKVQDSSHAVWRLVETITATARAVLAKGDG